MKRVTDADASSGSRLVTDLSHLRDVIHLGFTSLAYLATRNDLLLILTTYLCVQYGRLSCLFHNIICSHLTHVVPAIQLET